MPLDNQANLPVVLEAYTPKLHEGHFPAAGHSLVFSETAPARMTVYKIARSGCASNRKKEISCSTLPQTSAKDAFRWGFHEKVHLFSDTKNLGSRRILSVNSREWQNGLYRLVSGSM